MKRSKKALTARNLYWTSVVFSAFAMCIVFALGLRKIPEVPLWKGSPKFNANNAYEWTNKLARGFPNRVPWRPERKAASRYLQGEFRKLGYSPEIITFNETIGHRQVEGLENIYATLPGKELPHEYVIVLAHYDITDTTIEGASDDASGVGIVLELARIFKEGPQPKRSVVFLLTDSEEFGAFWGAHNFVQKFKASDRILAALSLDFVAPDEQEAIMVLVDGLQRGYAPLWLRETALNAIRSINYPAEDTKHFVEFVQRAILIPPADHGAFLHYGIPAVNLFGRSTDFTYQMSKIHHTPEDNMTHLRRESFIPFGKSAEIILRSIDLSGQRVDHPSTRESSYWKLTDHLYLTGEMTHLLHFFAFIPFITFVGIRVRNLYTKGRKRIVNVMRNEAKSVSLIMASLMSGYACIRLLPELKIIQKYEMFPATQKSVLLDHPEVFPLILVICVIVAMYLGLSRIFADKADRKYSNPEDIEIRHSLLGVILGFVIFLAMLKNSYLVALMLLPPSYLWMFMKSSRNPNSRALNGMLFLGGMVSFIAVTLAMTTVFHIGVFYWYLFLAVAYGLISVYAAIIAFAVITIGIRILRNTVL